MPMAMMDIREVMMRMYGWLVDMAMTVLNLTVGGAHVRMPVVLIVHMRMLMFDVLMSMLMIMPFSQMQPDSHGHE